MQTLQSTLLNQSNIISSQDTNIEKSIQSAITGIQTSADKSKQALESSANREISFQKEQFGQQRTAALEAGRGGAVGTVALADLDTRTEKSLRDMEQRKQELILQGDAAAAGKISDLQLKSLEFQQQARQQVFSNLLSLGNFAISKQQENRLSSQQNFAEKQAINSVALKYGLSVSAGETLDSITTKAMPFASEEQKLSLAKTRADIARANAEAQKALKGDKVKMDQLTAMTLAQSINDKIESGDIATANFMLQSVEKAGGPEGLAMLEQAKAAILKDKYSGDSLRMDISENYANGDSQGSIIDFINNNPLMTPAQKEEAKKLAEELAPKSASGGRNLFDDMSGLGNTIIDAEKSILKYITGY